MVTKKRTSDAAELPNKAADRGQDTARPIQEDDEMGEFEDRWEDEIEEEVVDKDVMEEDEDGDGELQDAWTLADKTQTLRRPRRTRTRPSRSARRTCLA